MLKEAIYSLFISKRKEVPFITVLGILIAFTISRLIVALIYSGVLPEQLFFQVTIRGEFVHIHHFVYGIIILAIVGYIALGLPKILQRFYHLITLIYGVSLGLILDETALWLHLEDTYYHRLSYDAVIVVVSLLILILYFPPFWKWMKRKVSKKKNISDGMDDL